MVNPMKYMKQSNKPPVQLTVRLPGKIHTKLKAERKKRGVTFNVLINEIMEKHYAE